MAPIMSSSVGTGLTTASFGKEEKDETFSGLAGTERYQLTTLTYHYHLSPLQEQNREKYL